MKGVITQEMAIKAYLHGACRLPEIGKKISDFSTSELCWAKDKKLFSDKEVKASTGKSLPVWLLSGDGSGYGYGYGSGSGDGYGSGSGSGDGSGYGSGDGSGDGYGYGYGYGDGYGYGYGYGYGDGYGYGYGSGSGSGDGFKVIEDLLTKGKSK